MLDIQGGRDERGIALSKAGISGLRHGIVVTDAPEGLQHSVGTYELSASVRSSERGTHMSRFLEVLTEGGFRVGAKELVEVAERARVRLEAESARVTVRFPFFLPRVAPASKVEGALDVDGSYEAVSTADGCELATGVTLPVTSLCPCSKAISDYGAHNQRGLVKLEVVSHPGASLTLGELAQLCEVGSAPVYAVLKRADERHVTMQAYDNPRFVEDMARELMVRVGRESRILGGRIRVTNMESIHNHDAFAEVDIPRRM